MPPDNSSPRSAHDWLNRAQGKQALAGTSLPSGGYWEDLCFYAQQAAEMAVKAVYRYHGWTFSYVHDLGFRLDGLAENGMRIPPEVQKADQLTI